jgi:hypothetical protein
VRDTRKTNTNPRARGVSPRQLGISKRQLGLNPRALAPIRKAASAQPPIDPECRLIPKWLRFQVLKRDRFKCRYCGAPSRAAWLQVDHVIPVAKGGKTVIENLITACEPCNGGKSANLLTERRR